MKSARILFASCSIAMLAACESPSTGVDGHDLAIAAQQLESIAHEAAWLAQQVEARDVTSGMAWVHQQALADDTAAIWKDLAKPVPQPLRAGHDRLVALVLRLQEHVSGIAPAASTRGELESLQREFDEIARAAHPLEAGA